MCGRARMIRWTPKNKQTAKQRIIGAKEENFAPHHIESVGFGVLADNVAHIAVEETGLARSDGLPHTRTHTHTQRDRERQRETERERDSQNDR